MSLYSLSFTEDFFFGHTDYYEIESSEYPTNVLQAIISLPRETQIAIARDVLGALTPEFCIDNDDSFPLDVLEKIRETNLCDGYESPITVYIDEEQYYSVTVYEPQD